MKLLRTAIVMTMFALGANQSASAASERLGFILSSDGVFDSGANTVSATPFDPTSLPQDRFFGRSQFSSRAVAVEIILNAAKLRRNDALVYRRELASGYRVTTHWRLRASKRRLTVRYEIRF